MQPARADIPPPDVPYEGAARATLWERVDALLEAAPHYQDLIDHRVHLLAARRWRALGRLVPQELVDEERRAALVELTTPHVLRRVREATEGPLVLIKGPAVALLYPSPALRPFVDLDLLVPDARAVQRALIAAGFKERGDPELYRDIHHLRPLGWPTLPLVVEVHQAPKWPEGLVTPPLEEFLDAAVPLACGVEGLSTLAPAHHALVLAAHSWAHEPLRRLIELVDVAVMLLAADRDEVDALARRVGIERLWRTTGAAVDALLFDRRSLPLPLHLWARNVPHVRGRTVFESHLGRWFAPFWALPARGALAASAAAISRDLRPGRGESWRQKLRRTGLAIVNSGVRRTEHEQIVERRVDRDDAKRR